MVVDDGGSGEQAIIWKLGKNRNMVMINAILSMNYVRAGDTLKDAYTVAETVEFVVKYAP